jgi:hypothetical protein
MEITVGLDPSRPTVVADRIIKKNKGSKHLNQYGNKSFRYLIRCALDHSLACSLAHSLLARSIVRSFVRSCVASVLARSLIRMFVRAKMS